MAVAQPLPLAIADEPLPPLEAGVEFHILLHASGGVPPYVWSVASGDLPEGVTLTPEGLLTGRPTRPGTVTLTLKVEDSGRPAHTISKEFTAVVTAPLLLEWLQPPKVHDNRIDGSVQVSNGSKETFDLTVIIVAVAGNGRATAIGYERFPLKAGANNVEIPFGNTLPHGGYVVHADAIAEIPARNAILRQRLQTPQPLQIAPGP
jgi:Putative Ig domain